MLFAKSFNDAGEKNSYLYEVISLKKKNGKSVLRLETLKIICKLFSMLVKKKWQFDL